MFDASMAAANRWDSYSIMMTYAGTRLLEFILRSYLVVIFTSYKVQTPHYFFDFWRFLARERLLNFVTVHGPDGSNEGVGRPEK